MEMHNLAAVNAAIAAIDISAGELSFQRGNQRRSFPVFHGEIMGKSWENDGKMMGKWWENDGKMIKWWENDGKI